MKSVVLSLLLTALVAVPLAAHAATTGTVSGTVLDTDGVPVAGAAVTLEGPARQDTVTDVKGNFQFANVLAGLYSIIVTKPGFSTARNDDVTAFIGQTETVSVTLAQSTFSSLRTIANVSTREPGRVPINRSSAAVNAVSSQVFADQGQVQVTKVLNELPGLVAFSGYSNNASQLTQPVPQIRGALPYETESLIDGHPVSVGSSGFFSPTLISPALLQDVELVKGPGSMPTEINYAIGGTVNYRTLEPTRTPHESLSLGVDGWGGVIGDVTATGSTKNHRLDYAFGYAADVSPGPLRNYPIGGSQVPLIYGSPPYLVNGQQVGTFPFGIGAPPANFTPYSGIVGAAQFQEPMYVCCQPINTAYNGKSELGKLRWNFSQQTALTVSYLGGQAAGDQLGGTFVNLQPVVTTGASYSVFAPPPGYSGSVPAGSPIAFDTAFLNLGYQWLQQNLFQGELRTSAGPFTILGRYYSGYVGSYLAAGTTSPLTFTANAWGGLPLCPRGTTFDYVGFTGCTQSNGTVIQPTMTYFNGQPTTFQTGSDFSSFLTQDDLRGNSIQIDRPVGDNDYAISLDSNSQTSLDYENNPFAGIVGNQLAPSSSLKFTTARAYARVAFNPNLSGSFAYYAIQYKSHFSGDGGVTWSDATHTFNTPRAALSWRPNVDTAWRFSAGGSIAPPYLSLISSPGSQPAPNSVPATAYLQNANNGEVSPETAFGYDLGVDRRLWRSLSASVDLYYTTLHDQFMPETYQNGTFSEPGVEGGAPLPLYVTITKNLGHARYEGVEVSLQQAPAVGWGFIAEGSLQRAYPYDIPPGFYDTSAGPFTANQGIIAGVNFQPTGFGFNSLSTSAMPYSMGYGEINYRTAHGNYYNLGMQYFGPNNAYSRPPFYVFSAGIRVQLTPGTSIALTGDNITDAYGSPWFDYFGGIPVPLVAAPGQNAAVLGPVPGGNYGPPTFRLVLTRNFGEGTGTR